MNTTQTETTVKATRYITRKDCPCGAGRTSALLIGNYPLTVPFCIVAPGAVFIGASRVCLNDFCIACRGCGMNRSAVLVRGKFSAKHVCNAKCLASKGPACECSCGGKNHGASYGAAVA